jgi:hypothetical protein
VLEEMDNACRALRVKAGCRLVSEQDLWSCDQLDGNLRSLVMSEPSDAENHPKTTNRDTFQSLNT